MIEHGQDSESERQQTLHNVKVLVEAVLGRKDIHTPLTQLFSRITHEAIHDPHHQNNNWQDLVQLFFSDYLSGRLALIDVEVETTSRLYANIFIHGTEEGPICILPGPCSTTINDQERVIPGFLEWFEHNIGVDAYGSNYSDISASTQHPNSPVCYYWQGKIHQIPLEKHEAWLKQQAKKITLRNITIRLRKMLTNIQ